MQFGLRKLLHLVALSFFRRGSIPDTHRRSILFCLTFFALYVSFESINMLCLLLDILFFPRYRNVELLEPIFIIGSPRSGKTTFQRLMASDKSRFFYFRTWEIIFPAVLQKVLLLGLGRADHATGGYARNLILRWEARKLGTYRAQDHVGLLFPGEDDKLLAHILACSELDLLFPYGGFGELLRFDEDIPPKDQSSIMRFYLRCVQRQAYVMGQNRHFLSQTPMFSGAVENLLRLFPDAKFIYLVRSPLEVIPALIGLIETIVRSNFDKNPGPDFEERLYEAAKVCYLHPLDVLVSLPQERFMSITFESFTRQPKQVVRSVYEQFHLPWAPEQEQQVDEMVRHLPTAGRCNRDLASCSISRKRIIADLDPVFRRFGFDTY